jgi:hypothetical protein
LDDADDGDLIAGHELGELGKIGVGEHALDGEQDGVVAFKLDIGGAGDVFADFLYGAGDEDGMAFEFGIAEDLVGFVEGLDVGGLKWIAVIGDGVLWRGRGSGACRGPGRSGATGCAARGMTPRAPAMRWAICMGHLGD